MKQYLAFYRGKGRWDDHIVRAATRSQFSHVELVLPDPGFNPDKDVCIGQILSASGRDGGVREKTVCFAKENWTFKEVSDWAHPYAYARAQRHIGAPYDWVGIAFNFVIPIRRQNSHAWFCSELCGWALGLSEAWTLSPGDLSLRIDELNEASEKARRPDL